MISYNNKNIHIRYVVLFYSDSRNFATCLILSDQF